MKKLFYIVLVIAILYLISFLVKEAGFSIQTKSPEVIEEVIDVVETNPEITGNEDETILPE
ncbi:MAG: hypothetical protein R3Y43_04610 [Alphaproteobacteria bacterium]